jgi:hypothetical protein
MSLKPMVLAVLSALQEIAVRWRLERLKKGEI